MYLMKYGIHGSLKVVHQAVHVQKQNSQILSYWLKSRSWLLRVKSFNKRNSLIQVTNR